MRTIEMVGPTLDHDQIQLMLSPTGTKKTNLRCCPLSVLRSAPVERLLHTSRLSLRIARHKTMSLGTAGQTSTEPTPLRGQPSFVEIRPLYLSDGLPGCQATVSLSVLNGRSCAPLCACPVATMSSMSHRMSPPCTVVRIGPMTNVRLHQQRHMVVPLQGLQAIQHSTLPRRMARNKRPLFRHHERRNPHLLHRR